MRDRLERPPRAYRLPLPGLVFVCGRGSGFLAVYAAAERPRPGRAATPAALPLPGLQRPRQRHRLQGLPPFLGRPGAGGGDFFGSYFATESTGRGGVGGTRTTWRRSGARSTAGGVPLADLVRT
ncbi:MAG: hypothetical protein WKG00_42120 [Polyangiaceae bacterium]